MRPHSGRFLVTGARGQVGGAVVDALLARGAAVRALVRPGSESSTSTGPELPDGCEVVSGDLARTADVLAAAEGVDGIFLLAGHPGIDAALPALSGVGVRRAVLISTVAAASGDLGNAISAFHIRSERALAASGLAWTAVRSYALMSNVFRWTGQLAGGDRVRLPFADVAIAAIDPADVAEVVACCLLESGHAGRAYPVSGPEALTPAEQVAAVGRALGRSLGFEPVPAAEARRELAATTPAPFVEAFFRYYEDGEIDETTVVDTVRRITGRRPGTLAGYLAREPVARRLSAETSAPGSRDGRAGSR